MKFGHRPSAQVIECCRLAMTMDFPLHLHVQSLRRAIFFANLSGCAMFVQEEWRAPGPVARLCEATVWRSISTLAPAPGFGAGFARVRMSEGATRPFTPITDLTDHQTPTSKQQESTQTRLLPPERTPPTLFRPFRFDTLFGATDRSPKPPLSTVRSVPGPGGRAPDA